MPRGIRFSSNGVPSAGILIYNEEGIFCIREKKGDKELLNDIGGKYHAEDGDIFATISRELAEETYYALEITRTTLTNLLDKNGVEKVYLLNHLHTPVYMCLMVPENLLDIDMCKIMKKFKVRRKFVLENNPTVPLHRYSSTEIEYVTYNNLRAILHIDPFSKTHIHSRLSSVLHEWPKLKCV